ncbi:hypothetical protein QYM36_010968 [Artemia franciscana]|uniref:Endonuclease-reverse transcriptase n=1 Tax=Artemia franciscana TaxID=6661 RepID=A0AA88HMB1_ARTSF|nr:hypothetical protein QYM36_010968 [Artemia franciscana]
MKSVNAGRHCPQPKKRLILCPPLKEKEVMRPGTNNAKRRDETVRNELVRHMEDENTVLLGDFNCVENLSDVYSQSKNKETWWKKKDGWFVENRSKIHEEKRNKGSSWRKIRESVKRYVEVLNNLRKEINSGSPSFFEYLEMKSEIKYIEEEEYESWKLRNRLAQVDESSQMNLVSKLRDKRGRQENCIQKIKMTNGQTTLNSEVIPTEVSTFYTSIFKLQNQDSGNLSFLDEFRVQNTVSEEENQYLEEEITILDIEKTIKTLKEGKTPGIDGLGYEFYKKFWKELRDLFVKVLNQFINEGYPSDGVVVITLIHKGGEKTELKNR